MSISVLFRVDAAQSFGGGHVVREMNLVEALRDEGVTDIRWACTPETLQMRPDLAAYNPLVLKTTHEEDQVAEMAAAGYLNADVMVTDGYHISNATYHKARELGFKGKIIAVDEKMNRQLDVDQIVSYLPQTAKDYRAKYLIPHTAEVLGGPQYQMVSKEFAKSAALRAKYLRERRPGQKTKIVMSNGNANIGSMVEWALKAIANDPSLKNKVAVDVIVRNTAGTFPSVKAAVKRAQSAGLEVQLLSNLTNISPVLARADMYIGASAMPLYECGSLGGIPSIFFPAGHNQKSIAQEAVKKGAGIHAGVFLEMSDDSKSTLTGLDPYVMLRAIKHLRGTVYQRAAKGSAAFCDGQGATRIARNIINLVP